MTIGASREARGDAYNIVKALKDGLEGDPENNRDYVVSPPLNG